MFKRIPLSIRIALLSSTILVLASLAVSVFTYSMVHNRSMNELDQRLINTANGISHGGLATPESDILPSIIRTDYYIRFVIDEQTVRIILPGIKTRPGVMEIYSPPQILNATRQEVNQVFTASSETDYDAKDILYSNPEFLPLLSADTQIVVNYTNWRAIAIDTSPITGAKSIIFAALPTDSIEQSMSNLAFILTWTCILVLLVSVALTWFLVRLSMKPLRNIRDIARQIASRQDQGVLIQNYIQPTSYETTEIGSLEQSLNLMLEKINASFERQAHADQQIRKFIADSSHELRTPLSIILGYLELYQSGMVKKPEEIKNLLTKIEHSAERMKVLVNDLITLTRLDEGEKLILALTDPLALVQESADNLQALNPDRPIRVIQQSNEPLRLITVDPQRIHQVLTNLVGNINRYTESSSPVEFLIRQSPNLTRIAVIDHGVGVPSENLDKLFERFFVLEESRSKTGSGTGLGLAIAKSIMELHGGKIWAEPTNHGGLTIVLEFAN
ncbi:MAG: HAMP domain-containing histidine kinase [Bifidobacteriaceae bacterium]|jgi:two-component system OmpR family sensor kinase|nr:HAMP domain-containing histidine kinase [Bifidobacteriaceae bacterium]